MDEAKLSEIEARAKAATPGPWAATLKSDDEDGWLLASAGSDSEGEWHILARGREPGDAGDDARFMAAAREDVPSLVAEVRRLRESNEALVAAFDAALARNHDRLIVGGVRAIVPQIGRQQ